MNSPSDVLVGSHLLRCKGVGSGHSAFREPASRPCPLVRVLFRCLKRCSFGYADQPGYLLPADATHDELLPFRSLRWHATSVCVRYLVSTVRFRGLITPVFFVIFW